MYRCTKNTPQIAMHVSTLIHSQLLFKVAEVNPCRLCGQTNFRNLTDDFLPAETELSRWQHGFFQWKKREHVTKSSSKTQKKKRYQVGLCRMLYDMVIKTNRKFTQMLWYCVSQPWILGRFISLNCHFTAIMHVVSLNLVVKLWC